jgi:hypothetical protein
MSLGKPRRIYDDIVKMDQRKTGYEDESWMVLVRDRTQWRTSVFDVLNHWILLLDSQNSSWVNEIVHLLSQLVTVYACPPVQQHKRRERRELTTPPGLKHGTTSHTQWVKCPINPMLSNFLAINWN